MLVTRTVLVHDGPPSSSPQYTIVKPPSGRATTAARLHVGTPSAEPCFSVGLPALSKTCQASEPPRSQPMPSVHTRMVSPAVLAATTGCLRPLPLPGAASGAEGLPV